MCRTCPEFLRRVPGRDSYPRPLDRKSDTLTTAPRRHCTNFHYGPIRVLFAPRPARFRPRAYKVTRLVVFLWERGSSDAVWPILLHRFFTINTPNDGVSRKDVPFWGHKHKILHFDPISPKNANCAPILTGLRNFRLNKVLTMGMVTYTLP